MLLKVERLDGVGRFAKLKHKAPPFERLTLFFARNGYGKSTLCSVIRSASDNDHAAIRSRSRLGDDKHPQIDLRWRTHGAVTFSNGSWNRCPSGVYVFDGDYVKRNMHTGDSVTIENRRRLLSLILGADGARRADKISTLDQEQRDCTIRQTTIERNIRHSHPVLEELAVFAQRDIPSDIHDIVNRHNQKHEIAKRNIELKNKTLLKRVFVPDFSRICATLQCSVSDLTEQTGEAIKGHLSRHSMHDRGLEWLAYGVSHITDDHCPFCDRDVSSVDVVDAFKSYFNAAHKELAEASRAQFASLKGEFGEGLESLRAIMDGNDRDLEFWSAFCSLEDAQGIKGIFSRIVGPLSNLLAAVSYKASNPLVVQDLEDSNDIEAALDLLEEYDDVIARCNEAIVQARNEAQTSAVTRTKDLRGQ